MGAVITPEEFEALFYAVAAELAGYVQRQGAVDPEDLVAEVFATAWRRRSDLPPPALRRAWLFGTARRLLLADARRHRRDHKTSTLVADQQPVASDDDGHAVQVVARAMSRLSKADRELLQLTEWDRLTPGEIAVAIGVRPGTIRVRLHRARRALAADGEVQALLADRPGART